MTDLLLTYIVPVYNTAPYVVKCLQSLVNQGFEPDQYEIIAVDDGSTDDSRARIEAFAQEHPQVRLLCQANAGVSAARNLALDHARGRYVQFIDSDDYLADGAMAQLVRRAVDENLDVLMFNFDWVDVDGQALKVSKPRDDMQSTPVMTGVEFLDAFTLMQYVCWYIVRLDCLNKREIRFNTSLIACEDGEMSPRFMLYASRVAYCDASPYCYVNRGDSAMNNTNREHLRRRIFSQIDAAQSIDRTINQFEAATGRDVPASVAGLRNLYLYFSMTKALTCGCVDDAVSRIRSAGLYPFPCIGPETNYMGAKWKVIHRLMMHPGLWSVLSRVYSMMNK